MSPKILSARHAKASYNMVQGASLHTMHNDIMNEEDITGRQKEHWHQRDEVSTSFTTN